MKNINDAAAVATQYANSDNLDARINIHAKYSTNRQGFGNWIFKQYDIKPGMRILELGCGNGDMWRDNYVRMPEDCQLMLTDFSAGMLDSTRETMKACDGIEYRQVDIQSIPYDDCSFDVVIANMMLYHVPDLFLALEEVKRVLKPDGRFYCATFGENGIAEYLQMLFAGYGVKIADNRKFTLQNGGHILSAHFSRSEMRAYKDSLEVTDIDDLIAYMLSMGAMANFDIVPRADMRRVLKSRMVNGRIYVPKEYGIFIAEK